MEKELAKRSNGVCEICGSTEGLTAYIVPPRTNATMDNAIHICSTCNTQLNDEEQIVPNHWRCLNDSMWSEVEGVKVVAWRMLNHLKAEGWPNDLLEMMYMEDETMKWAQEGQNDDQLKHVDSNGVELLMGDSIVLIKDLKVKGGGFTAKRGTAVRNIRLVHDNHLHIEGKVDGQTIVILTEYTKK
jgi:protein PhnA